MEEVDEEEGESLCSDDTRDPPYTATPEDLSLLVSAQSYGAGIIASLYEHPVLGVPTVVGPDDLPGGLRILPGNLLEGPHCPLEVNCAVLYVRALTLVESVDAAAHIGAAAARVRVAERRAAGGAMVRTASYQPSILDTTPAVVRVVDAPRVAFARRLLEEEAFAPARDAARHMVRTREFAGRRTGASGGGGVRFGGKRRRQEEEDDDDDDDDDDALAIISQPDVELEGKEAACPRGDDPVWVESLPEEARRCGVSWPYPLSEEAALAMADAGRQVVQEYCMKVVRAALEWLDSPRPPEHTFNPIVLRAVAVQDGGKDFEEGFDCEADCAAWNQYLHRKRHVEIFEGDALVGKGEAAQKRRAALFSEVAERCDATHVVLAFIVHVLADDPDLG